METNTQENSLVVGMQQSSPEVMMGPIPLDFGWAVLQPVGQRHVAVGKVDGIGSAVFGSHRILLGEDEAHDFAQLDVVDEELDMDGVGRVLGALVDLIVDEVVLGDHLHVRVFGVDGDGPAERNRDRSIATIQGPPDALPETLVRSAQLRALDAVTVSII